MKDFDTRALMGDAKFYEGYSRWSEEHGRYETWEESVARVMDMHRTFYKDKMCGELSLLIDEAEALYKLKYVLGAQRALQFGGEQILKHQMRMYNCLDVNTKFVTSTGIASFMDYNDGDKIIVKTPQGNWKPAIVKSYGKQQLFEITFKKNNHIHTVNATRDHRWLLKDGSETTNLQIGDRILHNTNTFNDFVFDTAEPDEKLYWCYGYTCGDGTVNKTHSMVRLCGKDIQYESRFTEMGFKSSSSLSLNGDIICYTGKYQKTLPDPTVDAPRLIRAFVRGLLDANGAKTESTFNFPKFSSIQSSNPDIINFIRNVFPVAGIYPIIETDYTGQETNYGVRPYTIRFDLSQISDSKYAAPWKVDSIKKTTTATVWCLEVEDDNAFILEQGIPTGNCTSSYADRPAFFGELFYVLLCGAGAGFSVQTHHIAKLPKISLRKGQAKIHEVEDSIEGWAKALDVLMSSFFVGGKHPEFEGRRIYFDINKIRPKGSLISGGFKAPGPAPLRMALDKIEHLIQGAVLAGRDTLSPIEVYDICMHAADAVLAGGVRRSATICLFSPDDNEMVNAKTGNWYIENPQRGRSNNSALIVRKDANREHFAEIMKSIRQFGEPGFVFTESTEHTYNPCVEIGKYPVLIRGKKKISGFQGCVSYDTKLITKNGIEIIGNVVDEGRNIDIWNGKNWSSVTPIETGKDRELYRVTFSDGSFLDCTNNHKFITKYKGWNDYGEFELKEIIDINQSEPFHRKTDAYRWKMPRATINQDFNGIIEPHAYEYGWILGDGTANNKRPWGEIYEHEYDIINYLDCTVGKEEIKEDKFKNFKRVYINNVDGDFSKKLKYNIGLPKEIFQWDRNSIKEFIYGWIDSDGSTDGRGFRIYGREDKIRDGQLLLTKLGAISKVCKMSSTGDVTNYGTRKNDVWYLSVIDCADLTGKFKSFVRDNLNRRLMISNIEKLDGLHNSYCFEETELHQGVFNNVLTKQCNLSEINGSKCVTKEEFFRACRVGAILGTLQAGYTDFKFLDPVSKKIFDREALIGVSITGWMNSPDVLFNEDTLKEGAKIVKKVNRQVAKLLGINPAARTTCVKPSGNACQSFDSMIKTSEGDMSLLEIFQYTTDNTFDIEKAYEGQEVRPTKELYVYDENNDKQLVSGLYVNGYDESYEVEFETGEIHVFTGNHKLLTTDGWKLVSELTNDDEIISH